MKFTQRLAYYLSGFAIGLIILAFILSGKNASCDYGPNARTVKNITSKPIEYSPSTEQYIARVGLDSTAVVNLIKYGDVNFNRSVINEDSCNTYHIESVYKDRDVQITVLNCDDKAIINDLNLE